MFETVTTNPAAITAIIVLWSVLAWAVTYMYMSTKVKELEYKAEFLEWYGYEADRELERALDKLESIEREFGHVLDDYVEYYYSDGEWVRA
jgi:hypothetical protein